MIVNAINMVEVELPIHIHLHKQLFISPMRISLLQKIKQAGSLNSAAKELSISYQNAWNMVDEMNRIASQPLVLKHRGGNGGGGAKLSNFGEFVLKEYSYIEKQVNDFLKLLNFEINF
jgi:molybdate transport system regulatory protein